MSKKFLVHLLLALCIGLLPALGPVAAGSSHTGSMPLDCHDCQPPAAALDQPCAQDECPTMNTACGSHAGACFPGTVFNTRLDPRAQESAVRRDGPRYRPDIDDPLYRPPIS